MNSIHAFSSNLVNRQTDRQTNEHGQKHVSSPLSEVNNMKLVHWPLMGGLLHSVQKGGDWAEPLPAQTPPRCTKCNSLPINGQCTNHVKHKLNLSITRTTWSTRSSAVAERLRDASCHWIFCSSFEMTMLSMACVSPYQFSIETMSVSRTVF